MRKPSLYPERFEGCFLCGNQYVEQHHIFFGTGRRQVSDREGCTVFLCHDHHQHPRFGVHFDKELDLFFKRDCQRRWEKRERKRDGHESFISVFGRNYLEDE